MQELKSLSLKVDLRIGTDIKDACSDLCTLASRVGVRCEAKFNDVQLIAFPNSSPSTLAKSFAAAVSSGRRYKIATSEWMG